MIHTPLQLQVFEIVTLFPFPRAKCVQNGSHTMIITDLLRVVSVDLLRSMSVFYPPTGDSWA